MWRVELFGGLRAERTAAPAASVSRFPTRKTASLLAYLAYHRQRPHPREVLIELLWPEEDPEAARKRFSVTLSYLRKLLEPEGVPAGSVVLADRFTVQLDPTALS